MIFMLYNRKCFTTANIEKIVTRLFNFWFPGGWICRSTQTIFYSSYDSFWVC